MLFMSVSRWACKKPRGVLGRAYCMDIHLLRSRCGCASRHRHDPATANAVADHGHVVVRFHGFLQLRQRGLTAIFLNTVLYGLPATRIVLRGVGADVVRLGALQRIKLRQQRVSGRGGSSGGSLFACLRGRGGLLRVLHGFLLGLRVAVTVMLGHDHLPMLDVSTVLVHGVSYVLTLASASALTFLCKLGLHTWANIC